MGIYINDYLGLFQFSNEKFRFYQVLTFTFSHDVYPGHLIYNMVYLLIFSVQSELVLKKDFYEKGKDLRLKLKNKNILVTTLPKDNGEDAPWMEGYLFKI